MTKLYYIKVTDLEAGRVLYKIGITDQSIEDRFRCITNPLQRKTGNSNIVIEVLKISEHERHIAALREKAIISKYSEYLYKSDTVFLKNKITGATSFGDTELFYLNLETLNEDFFVEDFHFSVSDKTSTTKKGILAYYQFKELKSKGIKVNQEEIASKYFSTRLQLNRAKRIEEISPAGTLDHLLSGGSIKVDSKVPGKSILSNSLAAIVAYFERNIGNVLENSTTTGVKVDLTDSELKLIEDTMNIIKSTMSNRVAKALNSKLYQHINS